MRRTLSLLLPLLMTGCGAHATPSAVAPAASVAAAKAALGRPFVDPSAGPAACVPNVPTPRPPFSAAASRAADDTLVVTCVQLVGFHNFAGSGTRAIVTGTRGGAPVVLGLSRMSDFDGVDSHDASIDGERRPVAEVAALIAGAPLSAQFPERTRALVLALLR